ncbi:MAG: type III-B CRISPR module RAMP protein Cmr6 [Actinobacteria bacterium]|nr:type III-B CRISPR module RAMP protein Cmr6 [Actinomycetota bacterium]
MSENFGNISHYHYVQNKGIPIPANKDQVRWHNDLHEKKYGDIVKFSPEGYFKHPKSIPFSLKTTYPGLLIGAGYSHPKLYDPETEDDQGDYQLGFFFDHTTGLPVIPGSSVKGILKSVFPSDIKNEYDPKKVKEVQEKNELKIKYINKIINDKLNGGVINFEVKPDNLKKIFFERKQVFLDAYLEKVDDNITVIYKKDSGKKDKKGDPILEDDPKIEKHLFAEDYITPHGDDIFKEPNPIRFLKVASEVTFTFQFILKDYMKSDTKKLAVGEADEIIFPADNILIIFKQIILDFGIGAKRNVGYGQFREA